MLCPPVSIWIVKHIMLEGNYTQKNMSVWYSFMDVCMFIFLVILAIKPCFFMFQVTILVLSTRPYRVVAINIIWLN